MHGAAELFHRTLEIGATKSVTFKKNSVRIKNSLKNMLKIKKFSICASQDKKSCCCTTYSAFGAGTKSAVGIHGGGEKIN